MRLHRTEVNCYYQTVTADDGTIFTFTLQRSVRTTEQCRGRVVSHYS